MKVGVFVTFYYDFGFTNSLIEIYNCMIIKMLSFMYVNDKIIHTDDNIPFKAYSARNRYNLFNQKLLI